MSERRNSWRRTSTGMRQTGFWVDCPTRVSVILIWAAWVRDHWLKMSHLLYFSSLSLNSLQSISVAWLYPRTPLIMRQDTLPRFKSPTGLLPGTHLVFHCLCKTYNVTLVVTMVDLTHTFADCRGWGRANSQHFFTVINGVLPSFFAHLKLSVLRLLSVF